MSSCLYIVAAIHAEAASCGETSIELIWMRSGRPFGVTFAQFFPPSRVSWTRPSSVPAQIVPASCGDSARAKMTP